MTKPILLLAAALVFLWLAACSTTGNVDPQTCAKVEQAIQRAKVVYAVATATRDAFVASGVVDPAKSAKLNQAVANTAVALNAAQAVESVVCTPPVVA